MLDAENGEISLDVPESVLEDRKKLWKSQKLI